MIVLDLGQTEKIRIFKPYKKHKDIKGDIIMGFLKDFFSRSNEHVATGVNHGAITTYTDSNGNPTGYSSAVSDTTTEHFDSNNTCSGISVSASPFVTEHYDSKGTYKGFTNSFGEIFDSNNQYIGHENNY